MNAKVMISKSIMLPSGTSEKIRQVYIDAIKRIIADPDIQAKLPREVRSLSVNFGDATQRAIVAGTAMDPAM